MSIATFFGREMSSKGCNEKLSAVSRVACEMYSHALMAIQEKLLERIIILQVLFLSFIHLYLY